MYSTSQQRSLPSIQWLVPFEAAARHLSFKLAAEELKVTPPAVSQQVKALENHLGLSLFERKTRALVLTQAGVDFYRTAADVIKTYRDGCDQLVMQHQQAVFHVVTEPYIAHTLLIPNLMSFKERFPDLELRVEARLSMKGMSLENVDAGIRFGNGEWTNMESKPLSDIEMVLVGSPKHFKNNKRTKLAELKKHCFFYPRTQEASIGLLLEGMRAKGITPKETIPCESYLDALTAASEGLGVSFAFLPYANRWISENRLVVPFEYQWPVPGQFWLVCRKGYSQSSTMDNVYQWLKQVISGL